MLMWREPGRVRGSATAPDTTTSTSAGRGVVDFRGVCSQRVLLTSSVDTLMKRWTLPYSREHSSSTCVP